MKTLSVRGRVVQQLAVDCGLWVLSQALWLSVPVTLKLPTSQFPYLQNGNDAAANDTYLTMALETGVCEVVTAVPGVAVDIEVLYECWVSFGIEELFLHLKKNSGTAYLKKTTTNIESIGMTF